MSFILKHDGTCAGDLNIQGSMVFRETTVTSPTETISIVAPESVTSNYTLILPATVGTADQVLSIGSTPGTMEWVTAAGGGTAGGADTQIQFNNSTAFGGSADLTWDGTNIATSGGIKLKESAGDDTHYVTIQAPASISSDLTLTLPPDAGAASEFLQTDGSGNLIWSTAGGSSSLIDAFGEHVTTTQITTLSSTLTFKGVAWSPTLNLFAAVATSANVWTSTDGIKWTERTGISGTWHDMVWAPSPLNKFVAVAISGNDRVQYSSDGITWSVATNAPPLSGWRTIAYSPTLGSGSGRLAAISSNANNYMYSDDGGDTWITAGTTIPTGMLSYAIEWIAEINSGSGAFVSINIDKFYKSVDGIVWSEITISVGNVSSKTIAWSPTLSKLIAVGNNLKNVIYSTDEGDTWSDTNVTNNTDATWNKVIWSTVINKFIAVASYPKIIMLSDDGEIWENSIATDIGLYSITESVQLKTILTGGDSSSVQITDLTKKLEGTLIGKKIKADTTLTINNATISSGFTTTDIALPNNTGIKGDILVNAGSGLMAWTSPKITRVLDTTTLEYNVSADETTSWFEVDYSPTLGMFVAVGGSGTSNIMYSYDGTTWTTSALNLTGLNFSTFWTAIKWVTSPVNKFVICASSGGTVNNDRIAYSSDGLVWTNINTANSSFNSNAASQFRSIVVSYDLNRVVIGSTSGNTIASLSMTSDISNSWGIHSVTNASNGGTFIPEYGIILLPTQSGTSAIFSYTGTGSWESVVVGPSGQWYDAAWSPELGVCVICSTSTTNITTSTGDPRDSANWVSQETGTGSMHTVSWVKELSIFIAVGTSISTSPDGLVWTEITTTNTNFGHVYSPESGKFIIVGYTGTNRTMKLTANTVNIGAFKTNSLLLEDFNTNNNTVTIELPDLSGDASYTLVLPTNIGAAGAVLTDTAGDGILNWATAGGGGTFQETYNASSPAETVLDGTNNGILIKDNSTPIGVDLFTIADNAGTTKYFNVTSSVMTSPNKIEFPLTGDTLFGNRSRTSGSLDIVNGNGLSTQFYNPADGSKFYVAFKSNEIFMSAGNSGNVRIGYSSSNTTTTGNVTLGEGQTTGNITMGNETQTGIVTINPPTVIKKTLAFEETGAGVDTVTLQAPDTIAGGYTLTFPTTVGTANQYLTTGATPGTMEWATAGGGAAGGSDTQIQFNDGTAYNGDPNLTWNKTTNSLSLDGALYQSQSNSPSESSSITLASVTDAGTGITSDGSYLYMPMRVSGGGKIYVIDITSPTMKLTGTSALNTSVTFADSYVKIYGDYLYIVGWTTISIVDVSNKALPVFISQITTAGVDLDVVGNTMFVCETTKLKSYDVTDRSNITLIQSYTVPTFTHVNGVIVKGKYAYCCGQSGSDVSRFTVVDVSDPSNMTEISTTPYSNASSGDTRKFVMNDTHAFLTSFAAAGNISVLDITDPFVPTLVNTPALYGSIGTNRRQPLLSGKYLYTVSDDTSPAGNCARIDISNPALPVAAGNYTPSERIISSALAGKHLYMYKPLSNQVVRVEIGGSDINSAMIGNILSDEIVVRNKLQVNGTVCINTSLFVSGGARFDAGVTTDKAITTPGINTSGKGAVLQASSPTTGVTLNTRSGKITTQSLSTVSDSTTTFTVTNSECVATSIVLANVSSYGGAGFLQCNISAVSAGTFDVVLTNSSGTTLTAACEVSFMVI